MSSPPPTPSPPSPAHSLRHTGSELVGAERVGGGGGGASPGRGWNREAMMCAWKGGLMEHAAFADEVLMQKWAVSL